MRTLTKLLVCAVFSLAAGLAFSQPAPAGPPRAERTLKALGLTEDQITQVNDVVEKARGVAKVQRASVQVLEAQIHQAMVAASPDLKVVNGLVDQKSVLVAGLEKQRLAEEVQIRQIVGDQVFDQARGLLNKTAKAKKRLRS